MGFIALTASSHRCWKVNQTNTGRDGASLVHLLMCSPQPCPDLLQVLGELLCGRAEDMPDVIKRESSRLPTGLSVGMVQVSGVLPLL